MDYWLSNYWPTAFWAPGLWAGASSAGGGYRFYWGVGSPAAIDWGTVVGQAEAGETSIDLSVGNLQAGQEYFVGIRVVSAAGVVETSPSVTALVRVDAQGVLLGARPNAMAYARAYAVADGRLQIEYSYDHRGCLAVLACLQVAMCSGRRPDWTTPLATIAAYGTMAGTVRLASEFASGQAVRLAMRAVSSTGLAGPAMLMAPVAADSVGPSALATAQIETVSDE